MTKATAINELPANDMETQELISLLKSINERLSKVEQLEKEIAEVKDIVKGGDQPKKQITVVGEDGGPGCKLVAKIMNKAKQGNFRNGLTTSQAKIVLEKNDVNRSRQAVLNLLKKIGNNFDNYIYRKGGGAKSSSLHYKERG